MGARHNTGSGCVLTALRMIMNPRSAEVKHIAGRGAVSRSGPAVPADP